MKLYDQLAGIRPACQTINSLSRRSGEPSGALAGAVVDLNFGLRCALSLAIAVAIGKSARLDGRLRAGLILLASWAASIAVRQPVPRAPSA